MARKLRVQYPGAIYHVMNRGDHSEVIFRDDKDPQLFLATLAGAAEKTDWQIHALCLMSNHFHLVLETPRGNLAEGMKWLLGRIVADELRQRRWSKDELAMLPKAHPEKLKIAQRLRAETTLSLKWISDHLHMGATAYLGNCLRSANPSTNVRN